MENKEGLSMELKKGFHSLKRHWKTPPDKNGKLVAGDVENLIRIAENLQIKRIL